MAPVTGARLWGSFPFCLTPLSKETLSQGTVPEEPLLMELGPQPQPTLPEP